MLELEVDRERVLVDEARPVTIGRAPDCSVVVTNPTVSRQHLRISYDGGWVARDLGAVNGTYVAGVRQPSGAAIPLRAGLELVLGSPHDGLRVGVIDLGGDAAASGDLPDPGDGLTINQQAVTVVRRGPAAGEDTTRGFVPRTDVVTIGRGPGNAIVVHDPLVSVVHARLTRLGPGRVSIEDLNSTNGTFVNGARIAAVEAGLGDVISVGKMFLRVTRDGLQRIAQAPVAAGAGGPGRPLSLSVSAVSFTVPTSRAERARGAEPRKALLDDITFHVPERSLVAVIGPSGAGKSTLLKTMIGTLRPDRGQVLFHGLDMAVFHDSLADRVGMVPQDDLVHTDLTARQALLYAARLRFPDDTTPAERGEAVDWAIGELGLTPHADTRIRQLSGGQRKRVSTAMELLTRPDLLFLDEPTSGLDPNLDREVMELLRTLAHGTPQNPRGRTIVVITHSTDNLDKADAVLLLAPGGKVAYFGPPAALQDYFAGPLHGERSYAGIYQAISREPDAARAAFSRTPLAQRPLPPRPVNPAALAGVRAPRRSLARQTGTLLGRQTRLLVADRSLLAFTLALPVVMGLVTLVVGAKAGFEAASTLRDIGHPRILLIVVVFGAVLMGLVPSVRQLVGERSIYRREAGVGVRPGAYLASKVLLLGAVSALQAALLVAVALALNAHPERGVWGPVWLELFVMAFVLSWVSAAVGLLLSAAVSTSEQVMPLMVVVLMLQLVLCGGVLNLNRPGVNELSWLAPSRWGFAAGASTLDFNTAITCQAEKLKQAEADQEFNRNAREQTDKANQEAADRARAAGQPAPAARQPEVRSTSVDCSAVADTDPLWAPSLAGWARDLGVLSLFFAASCVGAFALLRRQARSA